MGIARRLYKAEALLACAFVASSACLSVAVRRREAVLRDSLLISNYARTTQSAAQSCRDYLATVLSGQSLSRVRRLGRRASRELDRSRLKVWYTGPESAVEELRRLSQFVEASQTLLDKIGRLESQGRRRESGALYQTGVRPLLEQYLASGLDQYMVDERSRRLESLGRARRWTQLSLIAIAAFAASSFLLFVFWTRRFAGYLSRNIDAIRRAINAVASGNFAINLEPERKDEMGTLAVGLNEMAARLEQAQRRLVETEHMAAFGQLASGAAHALNNPLTAIIGHAALLLEIDRLHPEDRKDLSVILEQAKRCDSILRNLRQFGRHKGLAKEPVRINETVTELAAFLSPNLELLSISLIPLLDENLPLVNANARELQQALYNLIMNAAQALRDRPSPRIRLSTRQADGRWVCIDVDDNGEGVPPENLKRIFEPFFTTRAAGEGAGLGLSSALAIARDHGGDIRVESQLGQGSRFEIRLPARRAPAGKTEPEPAATGGRILLVDDEKSILDVAERALKRHGIEVDRANDAQEALKALEAAPYDLILSDYLLPGMDGGEFYETVRREHPALSRRFIFSTGEIVSKQFQQLAEQNGIPVLLKPFDLEELLRIVRTQIARLAEPQDRKEETRESPGAP